MTQAATVTYPNRIGEADIKLSPAAQAKMAQLFADADDHISAVRLFVSGGGCGGMAYDMTYAETINDYDSTLEGEGFKIVVDPIALNYIQGCQIDFENDAFVFKNVFQSVGGSGTCGGCGGGGF
jgi:iron-sulfur cluster insertion protein